MKELILFALMLIPSLCAGSQSLMEIARKEAERRQKLADVTAKTIDGTDPARLAPEGAVSTSTAVSRPAPAPSKPEPRESLRSFQTRLQKLDRDIAQSEQKLKLLRQKADAERWAVSRASKSSRGSAASQDQMRWQILELEAKLESQRAERSDVFQAGRKAGYLPGELERRVR